MVLQLCFFVTSLISAKKAAFVMNQSPINVVPKYHEFWTPVLNALRLLGGSGTVDEINSKVIELMALRTDVLEKMHDENSSYLTEVEYRLAWARTYLKNYGIVENSARGVWALTKAAEGVEKLDPKEVRRVVAEKTGKANNKGIKQTSEEVPEPPADDWRTRLLSY
jgi:restriction system protein